MMTDKGVHIHTLTPEEKSAYLKDVYELYPEVRNASRKIGNQFIDILEKNNYRDK
jgi:hypothetical protein